MKDLIPVLESLSISAAVSLDDDYSAEYAPTKLGTLRIDDFLKLHCDRFDDTEINEIDDSGVLTILNLLQTDTIPPAIKEKVSVLLKESKEQQVPSELRFLEGGFKNSSIAFKKYTTLEGLPYDSDSGMIWFIDKEIGGRIVLPEILQRLSKGFDRSTATIVVVFTSDDSLAELNESWKKRCDYLVDNLAIEAEPAKLLAYSFFIVLKSEISKYLGINEFAARKYLSDILISSMSGYCISSIIQEMQRHNRQAFERLLDAAKDSNPMTFQNIQYNMVKEGEPNIYHALKSIFDYMQELEYTTSFEQFSPYIMAMKRLACIPSQQDAEAIGAQALKDIFQHYEWTQFQFIHRDANKTYADIANGDVFKLVCSDESGECRPYIGVLITQPCDCILRKDRAHTKRNASHFTLVLFEEKYIRNRDLERPDKAAEDKEINSWVRHVRKLRDGAIILARNEDEDGPFATYIDIALPKEAIQIHPFILDMASLNKDGKAVLQDADSLKQAVIQNKTKNWLDYYPTLKNEVEQHKAQIQLLHDKLGDEASEVIRSLYVVSFSQPDSRFCIERVGHLENNMTELISYNYITHAYRTGKNSLLSLNLSIDDGEGDA